MSPYEDGMNEHGVNWEHFNRHAPEIEPNHILQYRQNQYQRGIPAVSPMIGTNPLIVPLPSMSTNSSSSSWQNSVLGTNQPLAVGQSISSADGSTVLTLHPDGNLVLTGHGHMLWGSGTKSKQIQNAFMQHDGNLYVQDMANNHLWDNGASGHKDARLVVNNDGSMTVWDGSNHQIWDSGTQNFTMNPTPGGGGASHTQFGYQRRK